MKTQANGFNSRRLTPLLAIPILLGLLLIAGAGNGAWAADFVVTTPNPLTDFTFTINDTGNNPTLTLVRGRTYTFAVNTDPIHPFSLGALSGGFPFGPTPPGVSGDNTNQGVVTFTVPLNAANCGYYCPFHFFYGFINFVDPPPPDFQVTTPGGQFAFRINGQDNPTITLVRGRTYTFAVNTDSLHPFSLGTIDDNGDPFGPTPPGVSGDGVSQGTVTYNVPLDADNCGYYCPVHFFKGYINVISPPPPPTFQILSLAVGSNLVLTSTGTNTWTPFPEFSTNLASTNWYALTVQTNTFSNGTNETICGRPPGSPVFIRIRSSPN